MNRFIIMAFGAGILVLSAISALAYISGGQFQNHGDTKPEPIRKGIYNSSQIMLKTGGQSTEPAPVSFIPLLNISRLPEYQTIIWYRVHSTERVVLKLYNILGYEVATLVDDILKPGRYHVRIGGENLASGVYLYRIKAGDFSVTRRMIYLQ